VVTDRSKNAFIAGDSLFVIARVAASFKILHQSHPTTPSLALLALSTLVVGATAQLLTSSPYAMFRHDAGHSGRSPYAGPNASGVSLVFSVNITNNFVVSTPALDDKGVIYACLYDGQLVALNATANLFFHLITSGCSPAFQQYLPEAPL